MCVTKYFTFAVCLIVSSVYLGQIAYAAPTQAPDPACVEAANKAYLRCRNDSELSLKWALFNCNYASEPKACSEEAFCQYDLEEQQCKMMQLILLGRCGVILYNGVMQS